MGNTYKINQTNASQLKKVINHLHAFAGAVMDQVMKLNLFFYVVCIINVDLFFLGLLCLAVAIDAPNLLTVMSAVVLADDGYIRPEISACSIIEAKHEACRQLSSFMFETNDLNALSDSQRRVLLYLTAGNLRFLVFAYLGYYRIQPYHFGS